MLTLGVAKVEAMVAMAAEKLPVTWKSSARMTKSFNVLTN